MAVSNFHVLHWPASSPYIFIRQQYDLPFPEAVFDVDFYAQNPTPFCTLAKEIWPADKKATPTAESSPSSNSGTKGSATDASSTSKSPAVVALPTLTHSFIALLAAKGLLLRNYSQNIDGLEFLAGLDPELLVECHGHFRTASCIGCGSSADPDGTKESILHRGEPPRCKVKGCESWVKPDIVFFGEGVSTPPLLISLLIFSHRPIICFAASVSVPSLT